MSGRCLDGVWKASGMFLECVWKVSGGVTHISFNINFLKPNTVFGLFFLNKLGSQFFFGVARTFFAIFLDSSFVGPYIFVDPTNFGFLIFFNSKVLDLMFLGPNFFLYNHAYFEQNYFDPRNSWHTIS